MKRTRQTITFDGDEEVKKLILEALGKTVDDEGFIVEATGSRQRVLTPKGEEVRLADFAGVIKGSEIFVKSDIDSLMDAADRLNTQAAACST